MFFLLLKKIQMTVLACPPSGIFVLSNIVNICQFIEYLQWGTHRYIYSQHVHIESALFPIW